MNRCRTAVRTARSIRRAAPRVTLFQRGKRSTRRMHRASHQRQISEFTSAVDQVLSYDNLVVIRFDSQSKPHTRLSCAHFRKRLGARRCTVCSAAHIVEGALGGSPRRRDARAAALRRGSSLRSRLPAVGSSSACLQLARATRVMQGERYRTSGSTAPLHCKTGSIRCSRPRLKRISFGFLAVIVFLIFTTRVYRGNRDAAPSQRLKLPILKRELL